MINADYLKKLEEHARKVFSARGIPTEGLAAKSVAYDYCEFYIPSATANAYADKLNDAIFAFSSLPGIITDDDDYDDGYQPGAHYKTPEHRVVSFNVTDDCWHEDPSDEVIAERLDHIGSGDAIDDEIWDEENARRRPYYKEYLLPIPPSPPKASSCVYLTLAYEPYDAIKSGKKTIEYRDYTESYVKKLLSTPLKTVKFQRGYGGKGRGKPEQMTFAIKRILLTEYDMSITTDPFNVTEGFLPENIAIELGERIA